MKIYINARFLTQKITGSQRFAIEISKQLKKINPSIKFATPKNIIHTDLAKLLEAEIIGKNMGHVWEQIDLPLYLRSKGNPLLLNLVNTAPLFYKNQIVTIHDLSFLRNPDWFSKKFYYYYRFLIPKIAKNSLKIITVSEFSKKEIINLLNISEENIKVIYCAISKEFQDIIKIDSNNNYGNYILAVSSLDPRKNFERLLLAYNRLTLKDTKLVIAGSKHKIFVDVKIKNFIRNNKNIILTGYVSDKVLVSLYRNAIVFVYPSIYEGFGLPPLEAMACGCPVVASNAASIPEVCCDAAYSVDPYNVDSIVEGIYKVLTDESLRQSLIQKGFERVKLFSWEKSAQKVIKIIEEVLGE